MLNIIIRTWLWHTQCLIYSHTLIGRTSNLVTIRVDWFVFVWPVLTKNLGQLIKYCHVYALYGTHTHTHTHIHTHSINWFELGTTSTSSTGSHPSTLGLSYWLRFFIRSLSWNEHVEYVCHKTSKRIYILVLLKRAVR